MLDIPGLYLVCDEAGDVALLILDKSLQDRHHASVDVGANLRFAGQLASDIDEKASKMRFKDRVLGLCIPFDEGLDALPESVGKLISGRATD